MQNISLIAFFPFCYHQKLFLVCTSNLTCKGIRFDLLSGSMLHRYSYVYYYNMWGGALCSVLVFLSYDFLSGEIRVFSSHECQQNLSGKLYWNNRFVLQSWALLLEVLTIFFQANYVVGLILYINILLNILLDLSFTLLVHATLVIRISRERQKKNQ